jgi:hypothetical protein
MIISYRVPYNILWDLQCLHLQFAITSRPVNLLGSLKSGTIILLTSIRNIPRSRRGPIAVIKFVIVGDY